MGGMVTLVVVPDGDVFDLSKPAIEGLKLCTFDFICEHDY
jgi:hypothetical protein